MRFVIFCHSLISDWNHGNAHFLRGVASELIERGHEVTAYEPRGGWSIENLIRDQGVAPISAFHERFPALHSIRYEPTDLRLEEALDGADVVIVHEWNDPELIAMLGQHRARGGGFRLLFHDTHHRMVTSFDEMARFDLRHYDGVLAFGGRIATLYREKGLAERAWTWHEAADTRTFRPIPSQERAGDVVWVGNWGDEERTRELEEYLIRPVCELGLSTEIHGVRYPESALESLRECGIPYRGWLPNFQVPEVFSRFAMTVHVPRRPYVEALPGIPTIRVFEALACGIPLISAPWSDEEGLFRPGRDFLVAGDGTEMRRLMIEVLSDSGLARELSRNGLRAIRDRHTCAHRADELLEIVRALGVRSRPVMEAG